jgi:hypothetical protein
VDVAEKLTGTAATLKHIQRYPDLMERRLRTGDTNIPMNPFSTNLTFFESLGQVVSQAVSEE